jgi:hypothetical protein
MRSGAGHARILVALVALAGCGSDSLAPTMANVAGTYVATVLHGPGDDILAEGGSLTLVLDASGSVTGSFFVPASLGGPTTLDMAGTFSLTGSTVRFSQAADSFVRDVDWIWDDDSLEANWDTGVGSASARLQRQ